MCPNQDFTKFHMVYARSTGCGTCTACSLLSSAATNGKRGRSPSAENDDSPAAKRARRAQPVVPPPLLDWSNLPPSVLLRVVSCLNSSDVARAGRVCTHWRGVMAVDTFWHDAYEAAYPGSPRTSLPPSGYDSWRELYLTRTTDAAGQNTWSMFDTAWWDALSSRLRTAVRVNDVHKTQQLVDAGVRVTESTLRESLSARAFDAARVLLTRDISAGADRLGASRDPILMLVLRKNPPADLVALIIRSGLGSIDSLPAYHSVLHVALLNGTSVDVLRVLLDAGADVHARAGGLGVEHLAAQQDTPVLRLILERGGNPTAASESRLTPLHYAVSGDNVRLLLRVAAARRVQLDVNTAAGGSADTPLHRAHNASVAQALLQAGADPAARNAYGATPLHTAAEEARLDVLNVLLDALALSDGDINPPDDFGRSPLHVSDNVQTTRLLLAAGALYNLVATRGGTPLHYAVIDRQPAKLGALLSAGADPNVPDELGRTPLHIAARIGSRLSSPIVDMLIRHGALVDTRDDKGMTPLHIAARHGNLSVLYVLLGAGARPDVRDDADKLAVDYATDPSISLALLPALATESDVAACVNTSCEI